MNTVQSGHQTLASIDEALRQVRQQGQELDERVQQVSSQLLRLGQVETEKYKTLARYRLEELMMADVVGELDAVERRVGELLALRETELDELARRIQRSDQERDALDAARDSAVQRLAGLAEKLDRAEARTQERLAKSEAHVAALAKARAADAVASEAESKTRQAEVDRTQKGAPYESDPLFMYLWRRGYGTSAYDAMALTRFLDAKVADLCGYHRARPNYAMLLEIPLRLREHASHVRATADEAFAALKAVEEEAAREDGLPELRQAVEDAETGIDDMDEQIDRAEAHGRALIEERGGYAAGTDEQFRRAMELLAAGFRRESIASLRRQARTTSGARDDVLVQELSDLEEERQRLEEALAHQEQMHARHMERLQGLEQVRREFKHNRYDDVHSTFGNEALIAGILNEFLRGVASSADLWGTLRRHHRRRRIKADPGFGTGGFGRSGGVWRMPSPGRGSSPGRGGGGFRTGGGF